MKRALPFLAAIGIAVAGSAGVFGYLRYQEEQAADQAERRRERRRAEREEERAARTEQLREHSASLMPDLLEGVELGQTLDEVERLRPEIEESTTARDDSLVWREERTPHGAQILYGFATPGRTLEMVQVLSRIDPRGVDPHLQAMKDRYGDAAGVMRCSAQSAAGVPTIRFLWRDEDVSLQDILLVHPGGVSLTLYVAGTDRIMESLRVANCRPVRSRDELNDIPIATPEMLQDRATTGGLPTPN